MRRAFVFSLIVLFIAGAAAFAGCGGDGDGPGSHTLSLGGASHLEGHTNPLAFCTACHGANLRGGEGPSCYQCHNNADHTTARNGRRHRVGATDGCAVCHGPNNSGGVGPACSQCH